MPGRFDSGRPLPSPFPERLGRYELLLPIASGGMATVYLARAVGMAGFERDVALKLTYGNLGEDSDFVASLVDEARLAGRIRHRNVVSVLDVGTHAEGVFIVMEYVEGDSLENVLLLLRQEGRSVPLPVALALLDDVLSGLHAAHELRDETGELLHVVHRDVSPQNILLGVDGIAKLTDFGIAKAASRLANTKAGLVKGKLSYMAPEQATGSGVDRRVDIWAAGVLAWETLSGQRLYEGPNKALLLLKLVREPPLRLRVVRPDLPPEIDAAVFHALQIDRELRHGTAEAFALALRASGVRRAEPEQVAEFLAPLLSQGLADRRERAREVSALRQRVSELADHEAAARPSAPSLAEVIAPMLESARGRAADAGEAGTSSGRDADRPPSVPAGAPGAGVSSAESTEVLDAPCPALQRELDAVSRPESVGVAELTESVLPPPSSTWWLAGVVAAVVLLVGGALLLLSAAGDELDSSPATAAERAASPALRSALPGTRGAAPSVVAASSTPPSSASTSPPPGESASPGSPRPKPPAGRVGGGSTRGVPLGNPYKHP